MSQQIILASTSPYRSELLSRLKIPFLATSPDVDETPLPKESAEQTSYRLSLKKAQAAASKFPNALIIGSDQVALLGGKQLGKPIVHSKAVEQLRAMSNQTVTFFTSITLLNTLTGNTQTDVAINHITYRKLSEIQIENYLHKEQPYQCAGSVKSEGLGIALIQSIEGEDPNALIGLPIIKLVSMLANEGISII